jgi:hypothetical protein
MQEGTKLIAVQDYSSENTELGNRPSMEWTNSGKIKTGTNSI